MYRLGDVQVVQVGTVPAGARQRGELGPMGITGHGHRIPWGAIYFETEAGVGFVRVIGSFVDLIHEEHGTIRLPGPAVYRVDVKRALALVEE